MRADADQAVVVIYDGQCPLCSREIAHYRRRRGAQRMRWVDATRDEQALAALGIGREEALARFHVRDPQGQWRSGAAAFVLLWSQLPAYAWLARVVRGLRLLPLMERGYRLFLRWRRRRDCRAGACRVPGGERQ
jgi:predicted DCC family thiol-disulfide oxidoreductase YuxK